MPSAAKQIQEMTDGGEFERLALATLRRMKPDCEAVIHEGINADGKPKPGKVDGFAVVPGSQPPRCIAIACTTTKASRLRKKWLFDSQNPEGYKVNHKCGSKRKANPDPNDDGDLWKAIRDATEKRAELPDATFKIYLVANCHGVGDLPIAVKAVSDKAGVEAEIVEASRLGEFLDTDPRGEFVRSRFFGTPARHVSIDLLSHIGRLSFKRRKSRPDFEIAQQMVHRAVTSPLNNLIAGRGKGLIWLVAPPGKGKSVLAVGTGDALLDRGEIAVWLSERDVEQAEELWEAVDSAIRRDSPQLEQGAGQQALDLFTTDRRLMILIDDLHVLASPEQAFQKVRAWVGRFARNTVSRISQENGDIPWCVLCPIWPHYHEKLNNSFVPDKAWPLWEETVTVPDLSIEEARRLLVGSGLSTVEAEKIANELGRDPLLCSLTAETIRKDPTQTPRAAQDVIDCYLARQLDRAVTRTGRPKSEYLSALCRLSATMLRTCDLRPNWPSIKAGISDTDIQERLTELFHVRAVIHLDGKHESVLFNHDRFFDEICAQAYPIVATLEQVRKEPYFAEIIGRAIARDRLPDTEIDRLLDDNPLAVFCGLMFATDAAVQSRLTPRLLSWATVHRNDDTLPKHFLWEISRVLTKTDSPDVVSIVTNLPSSWYLELAGLRNGSVDCGINFCCARVGMFLPGINDPYRDAIMEHARVHHAGSLAADLSGTLTRPDLPLFLRSSCLLLSGFLGLKELMQGIERCWLNCPAEERSRLVSPAIWADRSVRGKRACRVIARRAFRLAVYSKCCRSKVS